MKKVVTLTSLAAAGLIVAGCASGPSAPPDDPVATQLKKSFHDKGIAKLTRMDRDELQLACSGDKPPSPETAKRLEAEQLSALKWPSDGNFFGDFKAGEKLAQSGRGMTWREKSADPAGNGGNCYNCHQLDKKELSFGTIGPSLWNYGKLRGVKNVNDPAAQEIIRYTWGKLWNSKAYSACSDMPRFGHQGMLNEGQLRDLMSLLLDPKSPVNQ